MDIIYKLKDLDFMDSHIMEKEKRLQSIFELETLIVL